MLCHPCILGDPQTKGDKITSSCLNLALLGAQKGAEMLRQPCILGDPEKKGDKISGRLTPSFSGAQKGAEMRYHPCILGDTQTKVDKISGSRAPAFSGPKRGGKCYVTHAFSGIPKQKGTKSEVATSPLRSRGARRGRRCCVTPPFSGAGTKSEVAHNWAHHLQACIFTKIGRFFLWGKRV